MDKRRIITHGDMEEDNIQWEEISKVMSKGKEASKPAAKAEPSRPTPPPPKTYSSLYAELWDKCNPKNFMVPYDQARVDKAILIYGDLQKVDRNDDNRLREIRDRAMRDLGITISTDRLYKELISYCDPQYLLKDDNFQTEVLRIANQFYAQVRANKNDIHALEKLASQMYADKTLSLYYEEKKAREKKKREERIRWEEELKRKRDERQKKLEEEQKRRNEEEKRKEEEKERKEAISSVLIFSILALIITIIVIICSNI